MRRPAALLATALPTLIPKLIVRVRFPSPLPRRRPRPGAADPLAAVFANAAPYLLFALGEQNVSSSTAGLLNARRRSGPYWWHPLPGPEQVAAGNQPDVFRVVQVVSALVPRIRLTGHGQNRPGDCVAVPVVHRLDRHRADSQTASMPSAHSRSAP
jgi:hypothetical protein